MNAFLDAIDLSTNLQRAFNAIKHIRGLAAFVLCIAMAMICVALAPAIWYFDVGATLDYTSVATTALIPTIPAEYSAGITYFVLCLTLLPTLIELFGSRLASAGIRVAAGLVYFFSAFDAITDWPRVKVFMDLYRDGFDGLGLLATPAFMIVRALLLFMASFGFELMFIILAMCALVLFINSRPPVKRPREEDYA